MPRLSSACVVDNGIVRNFLFKSGDRFLSQFEVLSKETSLHIPTVRNEDFLIVKNTVKCVLVIISEDFRIFDNVVCKLLLDSVFAPIVKVNDKYACVEVRISVMVAKSLGMPSAAPHIFHSTYRIVADVDIPKVLY